MSRRSRAKQAIPLLFPVFAPLSLLEGVNLLTLSYWCKLKAADEVWYQSLKLSSANSSNRK